nr:AmmeMemoRadiSam system protein B [Photobacterium sanguinicancri]
MNIRHPAVAGRFYDCSPTQLKEQLDDWLLPPLNAENKHIADVAQTELRALIVPHAGYLFSGQVAAAATNTFVNMQIPSSTLFSSGQVIGIFFKVVLYLQHQNFQRHLVMSH